MSLATPSLSLPTPTVTAAAAPKPALPLPPPAASVPPPPVAHPADNASATVTLSPQALSALAASHASGATESAGAPAPAAHDASLYDTIKNGISTAVTDVGDAIAGGAHAVVDGVETALSTAHDVVKGTLELPFAAVSRACDAAGAVIDKL